MLRYSDTAGSGIPVVFIHGAGADHAMFESQRDVLRAAGFRVVLFDLRGHGVSRPNTTAITADVLVTDVEALIAHLDLDRPILIGLSLGGNIGQRLVRQAPQGYRALGVFDSTWNTGPLSWLERSSLRLSAPLLRFIPARSLPGVMADASAVTESARADLLRAFAAISKAEFLEIWRATTEFVKPDSDYRTQLPLLLMRGEKDRTGNIATSMSQWAIADGVAEVVIPDAGHVVTLDAPEPVNAALVSFLRYLT
ncbi:MAG: alpha/beta fold hydrolase [[Mycobacterium] stephanolepidis]